MTIRYTCRSCESVLKIKDEKAGTNGKCPKCKTEFVIPFPAEYVDVEVEVYGVAKTSARVDAPVDHVDMPIELTPEVSDDQDSDPLDVLNGLAAAGRASAVRSTPAVTDKKPSVAELMRDFNAGKKKDRTRDSASELNRPATTAVAEKTVGTAANALSRTYQQKRDSANAPTVSAKDAKVAEQRALLMEFLLKKAGPIAATIAVLLYGYIWYTTRDVYNGLPLYQVTGKVVSQTTPVEGLRVQFFPVSEGLEDKRSSAEGMTTKDGSYRLIYEIPFEGAPEGKYDIVVLGPSGSPLPLVEGTPTVTVSATGKNDFEIRL